MRDHSEAFWELVWATAFWGRERGTLKKKRVWNKDMKWATKVCEWVKSFTKDCDRGIRGGKPDGEKTGWRPDIPHQCKIYSASVCEKMVNGILP